MAKKAKEINVDELKSKYEEIGSIKELAKVFHVSNNRIIELLDKNKIEKKPIGGKITFPKRIINAIVKDYSVNNLTMDDICSKYSIKLDKLRDLLRENGVTPSKWHGHIKKDSPSRISFLKRILSFLDEKNIEYSLNFKVESKVIVTLNVGGILIDLYKNKNLIDYNGYDYRTALVNKKNRCITNGFKIIQVFEDEYKNNPDITLSKIKHILNIDEPLGKIQGRKCVISEIDKKESELFLNENHIQRFVGSTIHIGAKCNGELVGAMLFLKEQDGNWNLTRFASKNGYICQGIGGKMFSYFIRKYNPNEIRSFADRRWTLNKDDNVYIKLGFRFEYSTPPAYRYAIDNGLDRIRREQFKKDNLSKKYNLPKEFSEMEMAKQIGYGRIWDCGLFKYVWKKEE